jgi:hypothetical protein
MCGRAKRAPTDPIALSSQDSVDDGDKDGKIQLREFLMLYTQGLDSKKCALEQIGWTSMPQSSET